MKILVNTSHLSLLSGVSNHYLGLKKYWSYNILYNSIGPRYKIPGIIFLPFDILKFIFKCLWNKPDLILLNPSLIKNAIRRDAIYLRISKMMRIRAVVFFHGWRGSMEKIYDENPKKFESMYGIADGFLVLSNEFRDKLRAWGIKSPIYLATTKVDDELLSGFRLDSKPLNVNILFLARVEKEKGIFITIDAFKVLKQKYHEIELTIAGNGSSLTEAKNYVKNQNILDVHFTGRISGEQLKSAFRNNNIYLLPSDSEGMPTSVLEAMAFGSAIITTPVGGINDFFIDGKMGYLIGTYDYLDYVDKISHLIENRASLKKISSFNFTYAKNNFMASRVAKQTESTIEKILSQYIPKK